MDKARNLLNDDKCKKTTRLKLTVSDDVMISVH